jgi:hypothetical protein
VLSDEFVASVAPDAQDIRRLLYCEKGGQAAVPGMGVGRVLPFGGLPYGSLHDSIMSCDRAE